jgi:hypothetical protein
MGRPANAVTDAFGLSKLWGGVFPSELKTQSVSVAGSSIWDSPISHARKDTLKYLASHDRFSLLASYLIRLKYPANTIVTYGGTSKIREITVTGEDGRVMGFRESRHQIYER